MSGPHLEKDASCRFSRHAPAQLPRIRELKRAFAADHYDDGRRKELERKMFLRKITPYERQELLTQVKLKEWME